MARKRLELKYTFTCDPYDLYVALCKPEVLRNWIAERVEYDEFGHTYTFYWLDSSESAQLVLQDEKLRALTWKWLDAGYESTEYTRFRVGEADEAWYVDLFIEDYCDEEDEALSREDWDSQMKRLSLLV